MSKRFVSLILCLLLLLPVFMSCADEAAGETTDTAGTAAETETAAETDPRDIPDGLPDRDYNEDTFTLRYSSESVTRTAKTSPIISKV